MKLCDRCRVPSCSLNYLGTACKKARKRDCPDVRPNNAEVLSEMTTEMMANHIMAFLVDTIPIPTGFSERDIRDWLETDCESNQ